MGRGGDIIGYESTVCSSQWRFCLVLVLAECVVELCVVLVYVYYHFFVQ